MATVSPDMAWSVELELINDELESLNATARASERTQLLAWLEQKMVEAGVAGLPDTDREFVKLYDEFCRWNTQVNPLEQCWQRAFRILQLALEISASLGSLLGIALQTPDLSAPSPAGANIVALDKLCAAANDLMPLSPDFERGIAAVQVNYQQCWLKQPSTAYQRDSAGRAFLDANDAKCTELASLIDTDLPQLKTLLTVFQQTSALREKIDDLTERYSNAGKPHGSWRMATLTSISNILHNVQDARVKTNSVLADKSLVIVAPAPTVDDPLRHLEPSATHSYKPEPAITWAVTTARKKLDDFLAARAKLKTKRGLTPKQQQTLSELEEEDKRVKVLISKLRAEAIAQQSVVRQSGDGAIKHFA